MTNIAIIFAGGVGTRLNNQDNIPKQFININSKPIIIHTLELFQKNSNIDKIYIAIHGDYYEYIQELIEYYHISKVKGVVKGGANGQESIYNALKLASSENDGDSIVLIHDGVRPNISQEVIDNNIDSVKKYGSAITCTPCCETVLISKDGLHSEDVPYRHETYSAQAPQSFILDEILHAHEEERKINPQYTNVIDSCTLYTKQGKSTVLVRGNLGNIKITTVEDLYVLRALIRFNEDIEVFNLNKKDNYAN